MAPTYNSGKAGRIIMKILLRGKGPKDKLSRDMMVRLATDYNAFEYSSNRRKWTTFELCQKYGITRPTLYRYLKILREEKI